MFNEMNFEVLTTKSLHVPALTITKTHLRFSRTLVHEMGNPLFVRMLVDRKNGIFAVCECKSSDENAYKFAHFKGLQKKPIACGAQLIHGPVFNMAQKMIKEGERFYVLGEFDNVKKAMVFDLKKSKILQRK